MSSLADIVPPGVVTGDNLVKLLDHARINGYAIRKFLASSTYRTCFCAAMRQMDVLIITMLRVRVRVRVRIG